VAVMPVVLVVVAFDVVFDVVAVVGTGVSLIG
jgi:hypothetical protein